MEPSIGRRTGARTCIAWLLLSAPALAQSTTGVSVDSSGTQANAGDFFARAAVSSDGRYVAFSSVATNLVAGDTNSFGDVFLHDRQIGTTQLVSAGAGGAPGTGESEAPAISADGRYVAYASDAPDLVPGDTNGFSDVFVFDRVNGTTELASVDSSGFQGGAASTNPALSADGRFVAFESNAANLVVGDTNAVRDVFVRDRLLGTTERVDVDSSGAQANVNAFAPSISADGRYVAFFTPASNLVPGDTNGFADVFVRDRLLNTTERISVSTGGVQGNLPSNSPAISADGRYVAFASLAETFFGGDTNGWYDAFVRDRQLGVTERVSFGIGGTPVNGNSTGALPISTDGRYVAFSSTGSNLVAVDTNGTWDVFVRDRQTATTELASVDSGSAQGNGINIASSSSGDARFLAFLSSSTNLVPADTNGAVDVFLRDRHASVTPFCVGDGSDPSHTTACPCANSGAAGNGCANSVNAAGAHLSLSGSVPSDTAVLEGSGMPLTVAGIYLQGDALADAVFGDGVRCTGGALLRLRTKTNAGGVSSFPDSTDTITLSQRGGVGAGTGVTRWYQTHYRNAATGFCPPETFNVTNGLVVVW